MPWFIYSILLLGSPSKRAQRAEGMALLEEPLLECRRLFRACDREAYKTDPSAFEALCRLPSKTPKAEEFKSFEHGVIGPDVMASLFADAHEAPRFYYLNSLL